MLKSNSLNVSLEKAKNFENYTQVFAVWIPDELRGKDATDYFNNVCNYFYKELELNKELIVNFNDAKKEDKRIKAILSIEGGAACFKDDELGKALYRLKNFGIRGPEVVDGVGTNAKMNEFCAAMGICNLRHIEGEIAKRKLVVEKYLECLNGVDGIQLNPVQDDVEPNYAYFPVVFDEKVFGATRNEVMTKLAEQGIGDGQSSRSHR